MHTYVKVTPADDNAPAGKLADVELHFAGGELDGLKLIGFAVWTRRDGNGLSVTFPTRQFMARGGEKRNFSLVRAIENPEAERRLRDFILQAHPRTSQRNPQPARSRRQLERRPRAPLRSFGNRRTP